MWNPYEFLLGNSLTDAFIGVTYMNPWDRFLNDYLYPLLAFLALIVFLSGQAKAHDTQSEALIEALHDCRNTGMFLTMECATAVVKSVDGQYRIMPVSVGTAKAFKLHLSMSQGDILVCVFHTHPGKDPNADLFSDLDVRVAEKLSVPSYIFVLHTQQMRVYYPNKRVLSASNEDHGKLAP
jgi:proteasome lid subunit RPN8/RPN11